MIEPCHGSVALAAGTLTRHTLRTRYVALHHDVYVPRTAEVDATVRAKAAWLRCREHGVLAGFSAAALHGARWIDAARPATVIDTNRRRCAGIEVWSDAVDDDEVCVFEGMRLTTPARTAVDLARRYPRDAAVTAVDALARAAHLSAEDLTSALDRHRGRAGITRARAAIALVDAGAQSPKETWLRLAIHRAGLPRPATQVPVRNEYGALIGVVDLAWPHLQIAVEYEGAQHRMSQEAFAKDIRRYDEMLELGWLVIRVTAADTEATVLRRVRLAWQRRAAV